MRPILALALSAGLALSGPALCGSAFADGMAMPKKAAPASSADKAFEASMSKMMSGMDAPLSGDTDRDFVTMMLPHHQSAVEMAKIELRYGTDPGLRQMATDIVASQDKEIASMKAWQERHRK
ncbi:CopM family metallochaperone [Lichenihabitans psoromatis]|uniref:CopM family metallochaperone n=1 Tax=Lichenihabitans psoromatis TaxID=2528642 RepID=UPI0010368A33|nr:DUF305 domain-containing protein [Lichenihabitans psoromatis]